MFHQLATGGQNAGHPYKSGMIAIGMKIDRFVINHARWLNQLCLSAKEWQRCGGRDLLQRELERLR